MSDSMVKKESVAGVRNRLIDQVHNARSRIEAHIEAGNRDFDKLREIVNEYAEALTAADVLGGMTRIL